MKTTTTVRCLALDCPWPIDQHEVIEHSTFTHGRRVANISDLYAGAELHARENLGHVPHLTIEVSPS